MVFSVMEFNDGKYLAVPALIAITEAEKQTEGTRLDGTCGNLKPGREKNGASNKILKPLDQVKVKNRHLPLLRKKMTEMRLRAKINVFFVSKAEMHHVFHSQIEHKQTYEQALSFSISLSLSVFVFVTHSRTYTHTHSH